MAEQSKKPIYPVQPTFIAVRELHFVSHRPPSKADKIDESDVKLSQTVSAFNEQHKRIQVSLVATFGFDGDSITERQPFSLKVVMIGEFAIDDSFPRDKIPLWASKNAAFIIYPYLRERVYYICMQGGYPPILLPLLQIPTIKIEAVRSEFAGQR